MEPTARCSGVELPPGKICALDPVLSEACDQETAEECYEGLCLSYVAVTRAKRALYVLAWRLREGSSSKDFNRLLHETFGPSESASEIPAGTWQENNLKYSWCGRYNLARWRRAPADADALATVARKCGDDQRCGVFARAHARSVGSEVHKILAKISWAG